MTDAFGDVRFAVVDVETTGIRPGVDRIIEVAVIDTDGSGVEHGRWSTLVRPDDRPLEGRLRAVADAPTFEQIAGELIGCLGSGLIVGHNVRFDLRMIDAELRRIGVELPEVAFFDTYKVATQLNIDTPNRSLAVVCDALGVEFSQWHTAEGDADATARVAVALLDRAAGWGRTDISGLCGTWLGESSSWPVVAATGVGLRRDPVLFPPGGAQPGSAAVFKPSWRRYGTGESSGSPDNALSVTFDVSDMIRSATIKAVQQAVDERAPTEAWPDWWEPDWVELAEYVQAGGDDADEAAYILGTVLVANAPQEEPDERDVSRSDFYRGDFQGLDGIARLEAIVATLDTGARSDDEIVTEALTLLADLYRRHGGRHDDVVGALRRALTIVRRLVASADRDDGDDDDGWSFDSTSMLATEVARSWWDCEHRRRDVAALLQLDAELSDAPLPLTNDGRPLWLGTESVCNFARADETNVALDLYRSLLARWVATADDFGRVPLACAVLAQELAQAGRVGEAIELCEQAWDMGFADQNVANRHSLILEREKLNPEAVAVAERGLTLAASPFKEPLEKRVVRCGKRVR